VTPLLASLAKKSLGVEGRVVVSTFGLISRSKGLRYALEALPQVVKAHPNLIYLILGEVHPLLPKDEADACREEMTTLVNQLGLERHVRIEHEYLTQKQLATLLLATDVYLTPYLNREQIVSGTLAYAVGAGKAIISTPYLYAEEMLAEGRGQLVNFRDSTGIARALNQILTNRSLKKMYEQKTYHFGRNMTWSKIGQEYLTLFREVIHESATREPAYPTLPVNAPQPILVRPEGGSPWS